MVGNDAGLQTRKGEPPMSDTTDIASEYARRMAARKQACAANKTVVFDALAAAGIANVTVSFDGEGDSGQIHDITVEGQVTQLPDLPIEIQDAPWRAQGAVYRKTTLFHAVEALCYDYLAHDHEGWENNDGAYGEFLFDVQQRRVELDFNARFSDSVNSTHSY
jgi:hypothetical protein